jgi:hypothetical protein
MQLTMNEGVISSGGTTVAVAQPERAAAVLAERGMNPVAATLLANGYRRSVAFAVALLGWEDAHRAIGLDAARAARIIQ